MKLHRFLSKPRIIDLQSTTLRGALEELLAECDFGEAVEVDRPSLLKGLIEREHSMTTYLGNGIGIPHLRVPMQRSCMMAVGRAPSGLEDPDVREYKRVKLVILVLTSDKNHQEHLQVLGALVRVLSKPKVWQKIDYYGPLWKFREQVFAIFGKRDPAAIGKTKPNKCNQIILREALRVAKGVGCSAILVFGDTLANGFELDAPFAGFRSILVTEGAGPDGLSPEQLTQFDSLLLVKSYANNRLSQLRSAILLGLTRGLIQFHERLCCVGGIPRSNQFDTLVVVDVEREFQSGLIPQNGLLPSGVKPEVIERVIGIATELGVEGREGAPVGTLFVIGDTNAIRHYTKPLILNPFYGYKEEDRNILNPFMDETVKELSLIDGAFVLRGDGVIESAGTMIYASGFYHQLPGGLGTRHTSAAAISMAVDCVAITVSSSSGQVTLFRKGEMIPLIEKGFSRSI